MINKTTTCLGLGKTLFNSSASTLCNRDGRLEIELLLSERLTRQKASGAWPEQALMTLLKSGSLENCLIAENRDVISPRIIEEGLNRSFPFFDYLKHRNLSKFSSHFNEKVKYITHHLCHASAALLMSPYEKALVLVIDGAGSNANDFSIEHKEIKFVPKSLRDIEYLEESSVYSIEQGQINCLEKNWQFFVKKSQSNDHWFSQGLGSLYEKSAEYIFNDKRAAGKVMGLAAFGQPFEIIDRALFLENLNWSLSFKSSGKKEWESSSHFNTYANVAASVQNHFEKSLINRITELHKKYPDYENLILVGGCALNCTTNMKIFNSGLFKSIYVPPFPGDESIGLGAASYLYHFIQKNPWKRRDWVEQNGYFGSPNSIPTEEVILNEFKGFEIIKPDSIEKFTAKEISEFKIVGWCQGRSETGPRALGNRSILARVDRPGLKNYLNTKVKMRENFRPYGCSILFEEAHKYFNVPEGFENPYMSFAVKTHFQFVKMLEEVTHYDGTSRMQTVRESQNSRFYKLIEEVGNLTKIPCVLNTSLNVMGEPIVETVKDAKRFLNSTAVDGLAIGDFYIRNNKQDA